MTEEVKNRGLRKQRKGIVVSRSGNKSIVVTVESRKPHPLYGKIIKQTSKFHAHDEENIANVGDVVVIMETRPVSRMKRWRLLEVSEKAKV
ncbi:MAG: 30S ribosomal protein S17 [Kiritimatiellae bacterium]|nr:30S ribosomal protein S17 [Kiritimatiellia bacterium]